MKLWKLIFLMLSQEQSLIKYWLLIGRDAAQLYFILNQKSNITVSKLKWSHNAMRRRFNHMCRGVLERTAVEETTWTDSRGTLAIGININNNVLMSGVRCVCVCGGGSAGRTWQNFCIKASNGHSSVFCL